MLLTALAISIWAMSTQSAQPKKRVLQADSAANTQLDKKIEQEKQNTQNGAVQTLIDEELRIQQQTEVITTQENAQTQQNIVIQGKLADYTKDLIWVGALQGAFLFFTLLAIKKQANTMESYARPTLHIDEVRVINFKIGQNPIFFIKITNTGLTAAKKISVKIDISFGESSGGDGPPQIITIPAQASRECFFDPGLGLTDVLMNGFDKGNKPLCISGYIKLKKPEKYCYKYYPWPFDGERPKDLPLFVDCNFDPAKSVRIAASGSGMSIVTATLTDASKSSEKSGNGPETA